MIFPLIKVLYRAAYRNFAKGGGGGANLGYGKKRGGGLTIVLCEAQGCYAGMLVSLNMSHF